MISQSERDRVEYEVREKRRRDLINRDKLIEEHGVEIGEEKGLMMGRIQAFQKVLREPVTPTAELRKHSIDELKGLLEACEARLRERNGT